MAERFELFQIPAQVTGVRSMSHRSLRLQLDTQENLTDEQISKAASLHEKAGWFTISIGKEIEPSALLDLPPVQWEEEKSPAQRLRGCLYVLWQQKTKTDGKGMPVLPFEDYYRQQMERIINAVKDKLV